MYRRLCGRQAYFSTGFVAVWGYCSIRKISNNFLAFLLLENKEGFLYFSTSLILKMNLGMNFFGF